MSIVRRLLRPNLDGFLSLNMRCPKTAKRSCTGTVLVKAPLAARTLAKKPTSKARPVALGQTEEFVIDSGKGEMVLFQLSKRARAALVKSRRLSAELLVRFRDSSGKRSTQVLKITLRS